MSNSKSNRRGPSVYLLGASYLLLLIVKSGQSAPTSDGQQQISKQKLTPEEARPLEARSPRRAPIQRRTADQPEQSGAKFQARMMKGDGQQQASYFEGSDSWMAHNLEPTFTDQEQGDEMVALASSDGEQESLKLPFANSSSQAASSDLRHKTKGSESHGEYPFEKEQRFSQSESSRRQHGKRRPLADYLFQSGAARGDEDLDDESEEISKSRDHFQRQHERREQNGGLKTRQQVEGQFESSYGKPLEQIFNQTGKSMAPVFERDWQPANSETRGYANNGQQQMEPASVAGQSADSSVNQMGGQRSTGQWGSRDSYTPMSRTDAAIEFLKNVLKSKQNQLNNATSSLNKPDDGSKQAMLQTQSTNRPLLSPSRINQIFNNTASLTEPSRFEQQQDKRMAEEQQQLLPPSDLIGTKSFLTSQADAKFSILDAKSPPAFGSSFHAQDYPFVPPTTRPTDLQEPMYAKSQQNLADLSSPMNSPNGTPLGGDYVESLDEHRRAPTASDGLEQAPAPTRKNRGDATSFRYFQMQRSQLSQLPARANAMPEMARELPSLAQKATSETPRQNQSEPNRGTEQKGDQLESHRDRFAAHEAPLSSKIYGNYSPPSPASQVPASGLGYQSQATQPKKGAVEFIAPPVQAPDMKPPRIVSYNYFESPTEAGDSELMATSYQLGDALYSSNGGMEQSLSSTELEAIQSQFMTAEHPVVPLPMQVPQQQIQYQHESPNFAGQQAGGSKSYAHQAEQTLQRLSSPAKQAEEAMKELASSEDQTSVVDPRGYGKNPNQEHEHGSLAKTQTLSEGRKLEAERMAAPVLEAKRKKSLIVYLNHPRPTDMSKFSTEEGASLMQQATATDSFVSAKEFDSHGLSKDSKHLDVSSLQNLSEIKDSQDKDGLSVVVIGDAYKYKKIVLLISSKSGGLKFIPMVKDMKR